MKRLSVVFVVVAIFVALAAAPALAQSSTLLVSDVSPNGGSANVAANSNIRATFNMRMNRTTINATTFYLKQKGSTAVVPAQVTYAGTTKTATLNPDARLASGATYTAFVKGGQTGVRGAGGQSLGGTTDATATFANARVSWTFTVATPPETTIDFGPSGTVASRWANFRFSSSKADSSFQCSLDGASFAACNPENNTLNSKTYENLPDGEHTFAVRAIDQGGFADPTPARSTWTVDATGPQATITSGPTRNVDPPSVSFTFSGAEPGGSYWCNFDAPGTSADIASECSSGDSFPEATDGTYTFTVWARDALGNFGTAAVRTWTVDTVAPAAPSVRFDNNSNTGSWNDNVTNRTAPTITGTAELGSTVKIYDAQNKELASVWTFGGSWSYTFDFLRPGSSYSYTITAVDWAGNESQGTPITLTIDTTPPETTIDDKPPNPASSASATFTFSSSEANSSFECRLDNTQFTPCSSPQSYSDLADGEHAFEVRATDAAGNWDSSQARHTWTIETGAPTVTFTPANTADVAPNTNVRAVFSEAMNEASVEEEGTFTLKKHEEQGTLTPVEATVTSFGTSAILDPSTDLALNTTYTATLTTDAKDLAGNALAEESSWTFTTANAPRNVTVTPATLDFGTITFNKCYEFPFPTKTLTLTNNGPGDVTIGGVSLTNTGQGLGFRVESQARIWDSGPITVPVGEPFPDEVTLIPSHSQTIRATLTYLDDTGATIGNSVALNATTQCLVV